MKILFRDLLTFKQVSHCNPPAFSESLYEVKINGHSLSCTTFWSLEQNLPNVVLHALSVKACNNFQKLCMNIMIKT